MDTHTQTLLETQRLRQLRLQRLKNNSPWYEKPSYEIVIIADITQSWVWCRPTSYMYQCTNRFSLLLVP